MGVGLLERLTPGAGETDPFREVPIRYLGENILLYCLIIFTSTVRAYRSAYKRMRLLVSNICDEIRTGYANEVGESFRHVVAVRWVHLSYFISSGYVAAHALQQGYRASGRQVCSEYTHNCTAPTIHSLHRVTICRLMHMSTRPTHRLLYWTPLYGRAWHQSSFPGSLLIVSVLSLAAC